MTADHRPPDRPLSPRRSFLSNVLWSWASVGVPILTGLLLSPYIIRKLGAEAYGLWSLVFSVTGYYNLLDLGFRSAIVRFTAHFLARGENEKINELINTTLAYFSAASTVLLFVTFYLSRQVDQFFLVSDQYRTTLVWLVRIVGVSISLGVTWNVFTGCVEGFQRFDVASRIGIVAMGARAAGIAAALALGGGLFEMGIVALLGQFLSFVLYFFALRSLHPQLRFSVGFIKLSMLRQTATYGLHTFVASVGSLTIEQAPSIVIARLLPVAYVGYYNLPLRLLQYIADMVGRAGLVVAPRAAELAALGQMEPIWRLAASVNRYCFALFMPLAIVLTTHGDLVIRLWVGEEFARHSGPLLRWFVAGVGFSLAAQYTSGSVLFGLGKHSKYAWTLLAEALFNVLGMLLLIPRHGIGAAAFLAATLMILNRGLLTPWLVCEALGKPYFPYLRAILVRPLLTAVPVAFLALGLRAWLGPHHAWTQLVVMFFAGSALYYFSAVFTCLEAEHRAVIFTKLSSRLRRLRGQPISS